MSDFFLLFLIDTPYNIVPYKFEVKRKYYHVKGLEV